jgi:hypothetical protein
MVLPRSVAEPLQEWEMTRFAILITLSLAVAWTLVYGAMRTAERMAQRQQQQIERTLEE